jgi:GT2 family glycosyltransferase
MGRSPDAYRLWIERGNLTSIDRAEQTRCCESCNIWPIIDCRSGVLGLERTLASLRVSGLGAHAVVIGGDHAQIETPSELASFIAESQPWLLPLSPGDETAPHSLATYAEALSQARDTWLIYADDDLMDADGRRHTPHFKTDWNPELFEHHDFVTGASIVRADRTTLAALPEIGWQGALVRAALAKEGLPTHVREVLHHRVSRPLPHIPGKPEQISLGFTPTVTVIIPTRDRHELLRTCIDGLGRTSYPAIETIIVDNGSSEPATLEYLAFLEQLGTKVIRIPGPFNYSTLNNAAVEQANGELLCFLNNDVELTDPDWLALLVQHAIKSDVGAVGARLLYPDGTIQHAGVFTGIGGGAGHAHRFQRADAPGYFSRASLPQRVSAVTGACMLVARDKFLAVGGFDETRFPVAFNDVDLCLKLNARGWQSFYEPRATLIHHESKSRGSDRSKHNRARFSAELAALKRVWNTDKFRDPYHHPNLSPFCEQFLIGV